MKYFLTALALLAVLLCACGPLKKNEEKNAPKAAETIERHEETVPYILYQTGTAATESESSEGCRLYRTAEGSWCAERFATGNGKTETVRYAVDEKTAREIFAFSTPARSRPGRICLSTRSTAVLRKCAV